MPMGFFLNSEMLAVISVKIRLVSVILNTF
jgi:hypothetical protein